LRQRDQLLSLGVRSGSIFEGAGHSHDAVPHRLPHQLFHLRELFRRGLLVVVSKDHASHLGRAYVTGKVNADALTLQLRKILAESSPLGSQTIVFVAGTVGSQNCVVQRGSRVAFARDLGRNSLIDFRWQSGIHQNGDLRLAKHVNESRGNHLAHRVDGLPPGCGAEVANRRNSSIADTHISRIPGRAGAIDDMAVRDDGVEGLRCRGRRLRRQQLDSGQKSCGRCQYSSDGSRDVVHSSLLYLHGPNCGRLLANQAVYPTVEARTAGMLMFNPLELNF